MAEPTSRPPLWLLPKPKGDLPPVVEGKPGVAFAVAIGALAALVPAFLFLAPDSTWAPQELFVVLLVFGFVSRGAAARLRGDTTLDAVFVALLLAVVFLGPLPAAVIGAVTQIPSFLEVRRPLWFLSNVVAHTWAPLVCAWTLQALSVSTPFAGGGVDYLAITVAGVVLICVNYILSKTIVELLGEGLGLYMPFRKEFFATAPGTGGLIAAGVVTAFLYTELGIVGLAPLAVLPVLPKVLAPLLVRRRQISALGRAEVTGLYAEAIANVLRLDRRRKRVIRDAATHLGDCASLSRLEDFPAVMRTVLYCHEHWDRDGGFPGVVGGGDIPIESRILAVAEAWSGRTAKGTNELTPAQGVAELTADAGREFDPRVVSAAVKVIEDEMLPIQMPEDGDGRRKPLANVVLRA